MVDRDLWASYGLADAACHVGVALGDSAGVVRDEGQLDLVVADVDVWVVLFALGELGDAVDELHGLNEAGEGPVADEFAVLERPFGKLAERLVELIAREGLLRCIHEGLLAIYWDAG